MCALVRQAVWNDLVTDELLYKVTSEEWKEIYQEIKDQRIELLFSDVIMTLPNSADEIKQTWRMDTYEMISFNTQLLSLQKEIDNILTEAGIEYVVLKGSAAAVFYQKPMYRTMGDIDIIVREKDFDKTSAILENKMGRPFISSKHRGIVREYAFNNGKITIELHRNYAILKDEAKETLLDTLIRNAIPQKEKGIINNKYTFNMLPSKENGLVLLSHISQHMEGGLGLRQIIDWMMFVNNCLNDNEWPSFSKLARQLGLEKLAITTTSLCQRYLGLPNENIQWAEDAEEDLTSELMEYVLSCGNFGRKMGMHNSVSVIVVQNPNPITLFKNLQERGEDNWTLLETHPALRSFAWIYQGMVYIRKGLGRENAFREFWKDRKAGKRRRKMLERLGTTRTH